MSTLWEEWNEKLRNWGQVFARRAGDVTKVAADKADQFSKLGRLRIDLYNLRRERGRMLESLGKLAQQGAAEHTLGTWGDTQAAKGLLEKIATLDGHIKDKEAAADEATAPAQSNGSAGKAPPSGGPPASTTVATADVKQPAPKTARTPTRGKAVSAKATPTRKAGTAEKKKPPTRKKSTTGKKGASGAKSSTGATKAKKSSGAKGATKTKAKKA